MNSLHKNIYDPLTRKLSGLQLLNDSICCRAIMQQEADIGIRSIFAGKG